MKQELVKLNGLVDSLSTMINLQSSSMIKDSNPLNNSTTGIYSQNDEDTILLNILKRINLLDGTFAEFGVGNGSENNTLSLIALGFRGFWVGGEDLVIDTHEPQANFNYTKEWITKDNALPLFNNGLSKLNITDVDVLSLDLDGNDIYIMKNLLEQSTPKLVILEYNAKFIPPIRFEMEYDAQHGWDGTDYFGASLQSFNDLMESKNYHLICCNQMTGSNAFYIHNDYISLFDDIPKHIDELYRSPRYDRSISYKKYQHFMSQRTISLLFKNLAGKNL